MSTESHAILDGKARIYRRLGSRFWQCAIFLEGRTHRASTRQDKLALALEVAREWSLDRLAEERVRRRGLETALPQPATRRRKPASSRRQVRRAGQSHEKTFHDAADAFVTEYEALTKGERNPRYVAGKSRHLRLYLLPFFGKRPLSEVTAGLIQDYRMHRADPPKPDPKARRLRGGKWCRVPAPRPPARNTLHQELVTLRQVLKTANRKGWLGALPDMSAPYKTSGKISHRAWFSPEEYQQFHAATRERARNPKKERWRGESEQFHDYVVFMINTGLRPDEASRLEYRDVQIVADQATGERILEIEVRGKRGVGYCKSMPGAVAPLLRLRKRKSPQPTDLIFGPVQRELMKSVLDELGLKKDREGNARTAYSLRHTYICMRLMEGADIYQVAKNCRTSVDMIEKFYAAHIKTRLDAAAINVRRTPRLRSVRSAKPAQVNT